jgi:hypothetical protein
MRYQDFKTMYAGLLAVVLLFAVSCDGVISNLDDSSAPSASLSEFGDLNLNGWDDENNEVCETAFAFGDEFGNCFLDFDDLRENRWGWTNGELDEGSYTFDIYMGAAQCDLTKGTLVGELDVVYDDGSVTVTYNLFEDYYLKEVHIYVGNNPLPMRKQGRNGEVPTVAPGQYTYVNDMVNDLTTYSKTFNGFDGTIYIIAHAVVCEGCAELNVIYGVAGTEGVGGLWQIQITDTDLIETLLIEYDIPTADNFSGNGLAFDKANERLYFSIVTGNQSHLYFYDFGGNDPAVNIHPATVNPLPGRIYGATWGGGYWYIANESNTMRQVTFDADGKNGTIAFTDAEFAGGKSFNFGDIALDVDANVIYGSTSFSGGAVEFFHYDLNEPVGSRYQQIANGADALGLQLAFGENGVLYGHETFEPNTTNTSKEFFTVNTANGVRSSIGTGENAYNDLASGRFLFVCEEEAFE